VPSRRLATALELGRQLLFQLAQLTMHGWVLESGLPPELTPQAGDGGGGRDSGGGLVVWCLKAGLSNG
jgi:hypothetical protein